MLLLMLMLLLKMLLVLTLMLLLLGLMLLLLMRSLRLVLLILLLLMLMLLGIASGSVNIYHTDIKVDKHTIAQYPAKATPVAIRYRGVNKHNRIIKSRWTDAWGSHFHDALDTSIWFNLLYATCSTAWRNILRLMIRTIGHAAMILYQWFHLKYLKKTWYRYEQYWYKSSTEVVSYWFNTIVNWSKSKEGYYW